MKYPLLFSPGRIGRLVLKNRIVLSPASVAIATLNREFGEDLIAYYEERAKGGTGLLISAAAAIDFVTASGGANQPAISGATFRSMERLARAVHKYDAKMFVQLYHRGKELPSSLIGGRQPVSASELVTKFGDTTHALTEEEIADLVKSFAAAARLVQRAGFDGVEVHASHGYLLHQFMTPLFNKRTDRYGGSFENRMRFVTEVIAAVRAACGAKFPLSVRISAEDAMEGGLVLSDGVEIAKYLERLGIDAINVTVGTQEVSHLNREPPSFKQGWKRYAAEAVKKAVKIPVIAVNTIKQPAFAESLLEQGVCDFVASARGLFADPAWPNKAAAGKEKEIRTCIGCLACFEAQADKGENLKCTANPRLLREREFGEIRKTGANRPVVVVGGGPGGMEAAQVLSRRGFAVTLFEKKSELGGQLNYAKKPPNKEKIGWMLDGMVARLQASGAVVRLNTKVTAEEVAALNPVGVFLCAGSVPVRPRSIPGIMGGNVVTIPEVMEESVVLDGRHVAIVGSGLSGLEAGLFLCARGCKVTFIEMREKVGPDVYSTVRDDILKELAPYSPVFMPNHPLQEVTPQGVVLKAPDGNATFVAADTVLLAMGVTPRLGLAEEYYERFGQNLRIAGDADTGGRILEATRDGFAKAWEFEPCETFCDETTVF